MLIVVIMVDLILIFSRVDYAAVESELKLILD